MFARLGIGARLFIAFLGITALSLTPGLAGWLILRQVSQSQLRMTAEALPAVAATQLTAEASARLVAAAPALVAATDETSRARREAELSALTADIRNSVADAALSAVDRPTMEKLSATVETLVSNLAAQNRLVAERIAIDQAFRHESDLAIEAATAIVDLSETLVSNASAEASAVVANLYGLVEAPARRPEAYDALDRLIEQDIYLLDRMWELRLRSSQIGLLLNRLTRAADAREVADIAMTYRSHLRVVVRRVAGIDDPVRRHQAEDHLAILSRSLSGTPSDPGLFDKRTKLLSIGDSLNRVSADNQSLAASVGGFAQEMLLKSRDFARLTAGNAQQGLKTGLYVLLATSLVAVALSGLIVWLYVEGHVVRRLTGLAETMRRLTAGDLNVDVHEEGAPELRALSAAVVAFRNESQQRRSLELEREKTSEELRRHREELRELVDERTLQLRDANANLQQAVADHAAARHRAELASRAKSDFLATMSHEIRTPMTGMLGMLHILQEGRMSAEQRRQLAIAAGSGEALLGILNSILDYSKIESGKVVIAQEAFSLRECLQGIADLMQSSTAAKSLRLDLQVDARIPEWLIGDVGKIRQIVFNLVSNAIKFTESGQVSIRTKLVSETDGLQHISIAVADTGVGIAAANLDTIFEAFTQTDASIDRRYGGTGLGLSISKGLADAMGGSLSVQSEPGSGSTFTLSLALPSAAGCDTTPERRMHQQASTRRLKVLVVEDDEATRSVAEHFVRNLGHDVRTASDGYRALAAVAADRPDIILMDISLPGMDGIATSRAIREASPGIGVIAMSAHVFSEEVDSYLAAGMDAYVAKPLAPKALADAIAAAAGRRQDDADDGSHLDRLAIENDLRALGAEEMLRILDVVEQVLPVRLASIEAGSEKGDLAAVASVAHTAYSAATSAGFRRLGDTLAVIERGAKAGDLAIVRRESGTCMDLYAAAIRESRRLLRDSV